MTQRYVQIWAVMALALAGCQSAPPDAATKDGPANGAVASATEAPGAKPMAAQPACFFTRDIDGWNSIDPYTVRIRVGVNKRYDLKLFMPQPDLSTRLQLAIVTKPGGSDWVCSPMDIEIIGEPLHLRVPVREIIAVPPDPKGKGGDHDRDGDGAAKDPGPAATPKPGPQPGATGA
ncbi:DUF6491 family protein [Nitrospirillum sp. BR 11164]|uniref:DUF6491 family protein n=1 Tax=Nitrospirillum sp. BR 11164 TaxID=3104324 RepID=UPI002AFF98B3|nr:DUF6491 family protein [Nitrospirillum sp. BR 11164]MEA1652968.1 DUF6491 family protein [Nitrospirillum sp. BR 11164]